MPTESTITKLQDMRLMTMVEMYHRQMRNSQFHELSFDDRFNLLVDSEWLRRRNNKLDR